MMLDRTAVIRKGDICLFDMREEAYVMNDHDRQNRMMEDRNRIVV